MSQFNGVSGRREPYSGNLNVELLSTAAQVQDWRALLEAERPTSEAQDKRDKIYFAAGRYAAGARDSIALAGWLAIGEELT